MTKSKQLPAEPAKKQPKKDGKRAEREGREAREDAPGIDLTGTITSFTAENPTTVTMDGEDTNMLDAGDTIQLEPLTGDPDAMTALGSSCTVASTAPIKLDIDLSAANVEGLTADFTREAPDIDDLPPPNHQMSSMSPGQTTYRHPSPGVGGVPVEPNPEDTAPGTWNKSQDVPDPRAPLSDDDRMSQEEAKDYYRPREAPEQGEDQQPPPAPWYETRDGQVQQRYMPGDVPDPNTQLPAGPDGVAMPQPPIRQPVYDPPKPAPETDGDPVGAADVNLYGNPDRQLGDLAGKPDPASKPAEPVVPSGGTVSEKTGTTSQSGSEDKGSAKSADKGNKPDPKTVAELQDDFADLAKKEGIKK